MRHLHQFKLEDNFGDPSALYQAFVNRRGYVARPSVTGFDVEFRPAEFSTRFDDCGYAISVVLVHRERKAYPVMLNTDDLADLQESLGLVQVSMNRNDMLNAGKNSTFGLGL
jgi:hypothetical protein